MNMAETSQKIYLFTYHLLKSNTIPFDFLWEESLSLSQIK